MDDKRDPSPFDRLTGRAGMSTGAATFPGAATQPPRSLSELVSVAQAATFIDDRIEALTRELASLYDVLSAAGVLQGGAGVEPAPTPTPGSACALADRLQTQATRLNGLVVMTAALRHGLGL